MATLTTLDLRGETEPEKKPATRRSGLTLKALEESEVGQEILHRIEDEKRATAEREQADAEQQERIIGWEFELDAIGTKYEVLREQALTRVEELAGLANQLHELRARIKLLKSYLLRAGRDVAVSEAPSDLYGAERKGFVDDIRVVREVLPRSV